MKGKGIGSTIRDNQNKTQSAQSSAQNKHRVSSGNQYENVSATAEDLQSQGTQFPLKYPALNHGDLDGSRVIDVDLTRARSHVTRFRLTGGPQTVTFSKPPAIIEGMLIFFEITQDGVGGHAVNWPLGLLPTPILNSTPNAKTLIAMFSTDQGTTWHTQVFGSASGGGSGGSDTPWTENHDAAEFDLLNLNKLHFKSVLNSLQIARGGGAGFDALDYESVVAHDFYVNKSFNPTPRFAVLENSVESNITLDMNDQIIDKIKRLQFGAAGNEGTIDSSSTDIAVNTNVNGEFRVKQGGTTRLLMDDLTEDFTITGLDVQINGGRIFTIDDFAGGNSLQMFVLFGEQHINAQSAMRLQVGGSSFLELDTAVKAFRDIDLQENDILNIKTAQIEEEFASGFAPPGITDNAILFCRPSGSGKTELRVKFQSGNSILIAEEP